MRPGRIRGPRGGDIAKEACDLPAKMDGTIWGRLSFTENGRMTNDDTLGVPGPWVFSVIV